VVLPSLTGRPGGGSKSRFIAVLNRVSRDSWTARDRWVVVPVFGSGFEEEARWIKRDAQCYMDGKVSGKRIPTWVLVSTSGQHTYHRGNEVPREKTA
jgi:hypothetical protein